MLFIDAFCYGSEIRQFHAVKNPSPNGPPLIEDLTQEAYTLGLWSNRPTQDEGLVDVKKARALGSLREILASEDKSEENSLEVVHGGKSSGKNDEDSIGDERRYLVQRWTGGTLCDKTGVDRSIEVQVSLYNLLDALLQKAERVCTLSFQFHCNSQVSDKIFLVRETAICEYVMVIHTPRLCGEPIFVGGTSSAADDAAEKKRKELNVIECRPVVRDELYLQYVNAANGQDEANPIRELPAAEERNAQQVHAAAGQKVDAVQQDRAGVEAEAKTEGTAPEKTGGTASPEGPQEPVNAAGSTDPEGVPQVEEFVLGSYVLAYDRDTGEMTVNPDPEELVKDELNAANGSNDNGKVDLSQKEAETMQALLVEFRRSLEEMMKNIGGAVKEAKDDVSDVRDTIKKVQDAYEAAATGLSDSTAQEGGTPSEGGKEGQQAKQPKADGQSRFMRTGAHNHREIVEQYLKGQIGGLLPGKKAKSQQQKEATQLHRQREQAKPKMGTPQFRNLKRAFEQKWDDDASDNANAEGNPQAKDKVKNVAATGVEARGHDEL